MILNPYYQEWRDWADSFSFFMSTESEVQKAPDDEEDWRVWAINFVGEPDQLGQNAPNPYWFDDWREWAARLFQTVELTG